MLITMKDVMTANCQIPHVEMLTSNHCAALARELTAMFAAPVPPAGDVEGQRYSTSRLKWPGGEIVCSVDAPVEAVSASDFDAHVTRLQAEVSALQQRLNVADQRVCDLTADLSEARRQVQLLNEAGEFLDQVNQGVEDNLRAELTEARELITDIRGADRAYATQKIDAYLAHQSAPAAKLEPAVDCGDCPIITDGCRGTCMKAPAAKGGVCWSCKQPVTIAQWREADGNCPHCEVEIEDAEGLKP